MEKQTKLRAALYIRVSTEEQAQDGLSAPAQVETLNQYCNAFGIEVADVYMDLGLSGKSLKERHELERLMVDCAGNKFDMVVVWKISRLSRNLKDLLYLIDIFERNNVHFASCSEKFDTSTPVGRMTLQLLGSIAEFERNTIVENVKLGLREFARKGGKATSVLGYDNAGKKLVINQKEAEIVKMIFRLYTGSSMSFSAIAEYLNGLGCRTKRGSEFRSSSIAYIIHNPVYIGINRHRINSEDEYCVDGAHPAIIEKNLWDKAQNVSLKSKNKPVSEAAQGVHSTEAQCLHCNSQMKVFYTYSRGKKYKYLRCSRCSNYINVERLERELKNSIMELLGNSSEYAALYDLLHSNYKKDTLGREINLIDSEINRLEKSKARYLGLFENYKLSDTRVFIDRIAEIEQQLKALEKKKLKLGRAVVVEQPEDYRSFFENLKVRLAAAEPSAVMLLYSCLVKSIGIYNGKAKI
ncbi:MAG TPA: recombinase family protein, partial [Candidatus Nitrosocosmicus sp.]|nr:recombinase family protein [Candidatus Nitrosocosmicus sp.]